ncbi:MAG: ParA family protein [Candidatus Poribacteria bacterium]|nr:ParA family protein [Candidatus Poribacteria bacterium]
MKTIAILSNKGGVGKTTLAINLAVASTIVGKQTVLVDLDPQQSALSWNRVREAEYPLVTSVNPNKLSALLQTLSQSGADLVFIDTPPRSESDALEAATQADLILVPCRPAFLDLIAIRATVRTTELVQAPAIVVFNGVPARGQKAIDAKEAINGYQLPVAEQALGLRVAHERAVTIGLGVQEYEPRGKAAAEVGTLYNSLAL